jgi:ankyrin repeat protein
VGDTPLLVAVQNMQTKAALALIEAKADVNARNRLLSATPLMIAAGVGELTLVKVRQVKVKH